MWSLVTYRRPFDNDDRLGILHGDGTVATHPCLEEFSGVRPALDHWISMSQSLRRLSASDFRAVTDAQVLAPVRYPNKLLCAGANYHDHITEMGGREVPPGAEPWFFTVPPTTTVIGPGETVAIPGDSGARVDWEAELAVVLGRPLRGACSPGEALEAVAGYTILNDISARGMSRCAAPLAEPMRFDWLRHKAQDGFKPMGPGMTPRWFVDHRSLRVRLWLNGELMQDGNTKDMVFDVPTLLSHLSKTLTLEAGDVITTGTPAGVGAARDRYLAPGDNIEIEIDGLGRLRNRVANRARD